MLSLFPVARSNCGASSSSADVSATEASTLISVACATAPSIIPATENTSPAASATVNECLVMVVLPRLLLCVARERSARILEDEEIRLICNGNGSAPPLPLWERVGVRGSGPSIERNPSPGSHLRCDIAEALLRRSFPRRSPKATYASPTRGEVAEPACASFFNARSRQSQRPPSLPKAAASLRHALDDELSRLRAFQSDRRDFLLSRRRLPGFCFRQAVERNDDKPLRHRSVNRDDVFGAHNESSVESGSRRSGLGTEHLECFGIGNFADIYDGINRSSLGVKHLDGRAANCGTHDDCDRQHVFRFHDRLRVMIELTTEAYQQRRSSRRPMYVSRADTCRGLAPESREAATSGGLCFVLLCSAQPGVASGLGAALFALRHEAGFRGARERLALRAHRLGGAAVGHALLHEGCLCRPRERLAVLADGLALAALLREGRSTGECRDNRSQ